MRNYIKEFIEEHGDTFTIEINGKTSNFFFDKDYVGYISAKEVGFVKANSAILTEIFIGNAVITKVFDINHPPELLHKVYYVDIGGRIMHTVYANTLFCKLCLVTGNLFSTYKVAEANCKPLKERLRL